MSTTHCASGSPMPDWLTALVTQTGTRQACAVATVVSIEGSVSAHVGAKAVFDNHGRLLAGWVGGGCAQGRVAEAAVETLKDGQGRLLALDLRSEVLGVGMPCGGEMTVFVDPIRPSPMLWIIGDGPLAESLCTQAAQVGFAVSVLDVRAEPSRFPAAFNVVNDDPAYARLKEADAQDYLIIATQHKGDHLILREVLARSFAYVGLIASRHRAGLMRDDLMQSGLSPARWAHLRAPAGLDLGARMPAEIATAVIAELLAVRNGHSGQPRSIIKSDL